MWCDYNKTGACIFNELARQLRAYCSRVWCSGTGTDEITAGDLLWIVAVALFVLLPILYALRLIAIRGLQCWHRFTAWCRRQGLAFRWDVALAVMAAVAVAVGYCHRTEIQIVASAGLSSGAQMVEALFEAEMSKRNEDSDL